MLAYNYDDRDPAGYRALFYNGDDKIHLFSRNNNDFIAPKWFLDNIANNNIPKRNLLDGELFTKRRDFDGMGIVRENKIYSI